MRIRRASQRNPVPSLAHTAWRHDAALAHGHGGPAADTRPPPSGCAPYGRAPLRPPHEAYSFAPPPNLRSSTGTHAARLANPTARERGANARMGDEDAAEALSATGRLEGRVGETLRGEPPDDPRMGRDGSVGPGPVVRGCALLATSSRAPQAGSLHRDHRGTSRGVPRSVGAAAVRRGPRGGLPRWLQPCAGLRPRGTPWWWC